MFCPGCGSQNSVEQKFCRSCDMNLEGTAASMLEQFPDGTRSDLQRQERNLERFGKVAFTGFGIVIAVAVLGMLYTVLDKFILSGDSPVTGVIFIAFGLFAALSLGYVFWREHLNEKRTKLGVPATAALPTAPTGKLLEESKFEPLPSVVEGTTELLKVRREK